VGAVKRIYYQREDVYCSGSYFFPNSNVRVYILLDDTWSEGTSMTDLSSDGFNTVPIDGVGNLPVTMIWPGRLTIGQYDIVFDTNQDGIYQSGVDAVDDPGDPGFEVFGDPPGSGWVGTGLPQHLHRHCSRSGSGCDSVPGPSCNGQESTASLLRSATLVSVHPHLCAQPLLHIPKPSAGA
jgi:hypothetical protein